MSRSQIKIEVFLVAALLALSACSSALESEEGDSGMEDTVTSSDSSQSAPTDAVPADNAQPVAQNDVPPEPDLGTAPPAENVPVAKVEEAPPPDLTVAPPAQVTEAPVAATAPPAEAPATPGPETTAVVSTEVPPSVETPAPVVSEPAPAEVAVAPAAPVAAAPQSQQGYTVKAGDTLMKISWEQYGDLYRWREIYNLNKARIADPNHVPPGTVLELGANRTPASAIDHEGTQYLIMKGDTLGRISDKVYGTIEKWKKIWANNKDLIKDPNKIYAGFFLYYVPEAKMTSTQESEDIRSETAVDAG